MAESAARTSASPHVDAASPDPAPPPGFWLVVLGCGLAFLAPLAGFLGGTIWGARVTGQDVGTLSFWLLGGLGIGGIGVLIAFAGGMRWMGWQHHRS
ncbi:MAG: hypothetical protein WA962_13165 [Ornithinimicrobium sp.]